MSSIKFDPGDAFHIDEDGGIEKVSFGRRRQTLLELFVAVLIVSIVVIVFIAVYTHQVSKEESTRKQGNTKGEIAETTRKTTTTISALTGQFIR